MYEYLRQFAVDAQATKILATHAKSRAPTDLCLPQINCCEHCYRIQYYKKFMCRTLQAGYQYEYRSPDVLSPMVTKQQKKLVPLKVYKYFSI